MNSGQLVFLDILMMIFVQYYDALYKFHITDSLTQLLYSTIIIDYLIAQD